MKSLLLIPFLGISALSVAEPEFVAKAGASCTKITEATCWTQKSDADEHCRGELATQAEEQGADTLVVTDIEQNDLRKPSLAGGMKTVTKTRMTADLYRCGQAVKEVVSDEAETIESRLIKLKNLRDKSLISEQEYADLRQKILDEI